MSRTQKKWTHVICVSTVVSLILTAPLLSSCDSDKDSDESTTLPVSTDTTSTVPSTTYSDQEGNVPDKDEEVESKPSSGTINTGNAGVGSNDSQGLSFVSNGNGTCTLTGIGTCTDVCLVIPSQSATGDRVTAISDKAFYGNIAITAIFLPASVTSIGAMAFAACPSLAYFSVDISNPAYCSEGGVLYTADRATLLSYPAAKSTSIVSLPSSLTVIADMAFYGCTKLMGIAYAGTHADWQRVSIGSGNNSLFGLGVQYNSSSGK